MHIIMLLLVKVFTHPPQKLIANRMLLEAVADCVNTLNDDKDQFS